MEPALRERPAQVGRAEAHVTIAVMNARSERLVTRGLSEARGLLVRAVSGSPKVDLKKQGERVCSQNTLTLGSGTYVPVRGETATPVFLYIF